MSVEINVVLDANLLTTCVATGEVLPRNEALPAYTAVIACDPMARLDVDNFATPLASSGTDPSVVAPSMNATLPAGVPPDEVTVAVNVTVSPVLDGFFDEARAVDVGTGVVTVPHDANLNDAIRVFHAVGCVVF